MIITTSLSCLQRRPEIINKTDKQGTVQYQGGIGADGINTGCLGKTFITVEEVKSAEPQFRCLFGQQALHRFQIFSTEVSL
jgi:hypothetical protein